VDEIPPRGILTITYTDMKDLLLSMPIGTCKDFAFSNGVLKSTKTLCRDSETEWELNSFSSGWDKSEADEDCNGNEIVIPCTELPIKWQEVIKQQINMKLVTIFYNDVFVSEIPNEIYANCPCVNVPIDEAIEYADKKIENREWDAYCIPELIRSHQVIFH